MIISGRTAGLMMCFMENNEIDLLSEEAIYSGILGALSAGGIAVAGGKKFYDITNTLRL